ncbi:putative disease resistance protein RGA1 [Magnolia sinica]|uniref:putative disease resistance protein RGA1 n=1 Tax=Magnolia sinica TaxID=86752 RepID=UPI002659957A|nr:putative disease resistance protein RGA1 [Magnolia sinica]
MEVNKWKTLLESISIILLWRSFFQDAKKDGDGNIVWCKMHDLVHDLACSVAGNECSIMQVNNVLSNPNISCHLFLELSIPRNLLVHFMCLCVLDLSYANVNIGLLVSIDLPKHMSKMISLYLEINRYDGLIHMPANIGELKFLKTLPIFIVGKDIGCAIRDLQGLNLRGKLTIRNLENVVCAADAQEANLKEKRNLRMLHFSWGQDIDLNLEGNVEQMLEGLRPHLNLKRLVVKEYVGVRFPLWMSSSLLPNLVKISLINCRRCEQLLPLGQLPFLKVLMVQGMDAIKCIDNHFYGNAITQGFPSLEKLTFRDMPNLGEWSGFNRREILPRFDQLTVCRCPKLTMLPWLQSLIELRLIDSNKMLFGSVENLTSLSSLWIEGFEELRSLPDGLF